MIARLTVLCVVELALVVLLAAQVFSTADRQPGPQPVTTLREGDTPQRPPPGDDVASEPTTQQDTEPERRPTPAREPVAASWQADDPVGVLLTGVVRSRDGGIVPEPNVSALREGRRRGGSGAADGSFALTALSPGDWTITVRAEGAADHEETLEITDAAVQEHDFVVDRSFPLRVLIVTPDGEDATRALRLSGLQLGDFAVAGQRDRFPDRLAVTDYGQAFVGDAQWDREMNPVEGFAGTLRLQSAAPAHVALLQRHLVLQQQVVQPGQTEVRFVVDIDALAQLAASAVVRVVDAVTGAPIEGARLRLHTSNMTGPGVETDADGRAVAEGLSPGLLRCEISAEGTEQMYTTVEVEPGQRLDLGEVRLGAELPLSGRVFDSDGEPVGGVWLSWTELKWLGTVKPFASNRSARTDADGTFQLWRTGRGTIVVTARSSEGLVGLGVFENPPSSPVELRLAQPAECVITRPPDPTRAYVVLWFDARRRPIAAQVIENRLLKRTVKLPAGTYGYEVRDSDGRSSQSGSLEFGTAPAELVLR